ncbi:hypothetical protein N9A92_01385 [Pirellulales bacterium]|nr:hypothetical protein [Pirellulales bacterium]
MQHRRIVRQCVALRVYTPVFTVCSMRTILLFCLLALPALATDTTIVGKAVGIHDGDTPRTEHEALKVRLSGIHTRSIKP